MLIIYLLFYQKVCFSMEKIEEYFKKQKILCDNYKTEISLSSDVKGGLDKLRCVVS